LRAALNHAFHDDLVASDAPWRKVKAFRGVDAARIRYLTVAEAQRLINTCAPEFRPLVQPALQTGCRYGELCRLEVTDFNPDAGALVVPAASRVAVLVNPDNPAVDSTLRELEPAARAIGLQIQVVKASAIREINAAFATLARERPDALLVGIDPFFNGRRVQLVHLATRHALPASYPARNFAEAGGLMSYGANIVDAWREVGSYTGRLLRGAKPGDLPVVQSSKTELVVNAQTATMLGLNVPQALLSIANEVIE
jgi:hypothetical protein